MIEQTQGILLASFPYLGKKKILRVFSPKEGLFSLIGYPKQSPGSITPFLVADWTYRKGKGEIDLLQEVSVLDPLMGLKYQYANLQGAGVIAQDLLATQVPAQENAHVFILAVAYLRKLCGSLSPRTLVLSFRLKLLRLEGLLLLQSQCNVCQQDAFAIHRGESVCPLHAGSREEIFSKGEWAILTLLLESRSFQEIESVSISEIFEKKVHAFCREIQQHNA